MRTVRGFERPAFQWTFVALAVLLAVVVAALSGTVWRLNGTLRELRTTQAGDRAEREQMLARLARERSTREALALELARLRAGSGVQDAVPGPPTLTLEPLGTRDATPPPATMTAPAPAQIVELRLLLPRGAAANAGPYALTVRDWVSGDLRLTRGGLTAKTIDRARAVTAFVAGDVFAAGSHEVILRSHETEIATYEITVK